MYEATYVYIYREEIKNLMYERDEARDIDIDKIYDQSE